MTRKIYNIATASVFTQDGASPSVFTLPISCRLLYVQGEADGKPTYDFTVRFSDGGSPATYCGMRYVGTRNGQKVHLFNDWPIIDTSSTWDIEVLPGEGVNLQIFYMSGSPLSN